MIRVEVAVCLTGHSIMKRSLIRALAALYNYVFYKNILKTIFAIALNPSECIS